MPYIVRVVLLDATACWSRAEWSTIVVTVFRAAGQVWTNLRLTCQMVFCSCPASFFVAWPLTHLSSTRSPKRRPAGIHHYSAHSPKLEAQNLCSPIPSRADLECASTVDTYTTTNAASRYLRHILPHSLCRDTPLHSLCRDTPLHSLCRDTPLQFAPTVCRNSNYGISSQPPSNNSFLSFCHSRPSFESNQVVIFCCTTLLVAPR